MAPEKSAGNPPANTGGGNANKGANRNNRRRPLRSKRRGRKPEEGAEAREPRESRSESRGESRGEPRSESRGESRSESRSAPRENRESRGAGNANKSIDKTLRDNRERRRRRRMRAKQRGPNENVASPVEDVLKDLPPLVPAFVYTHVLRPDIRDAFEFRTEHFSKVTRTMEDFHIDLSPLYPEGGDEIKGVAYMPPLADNPEFARDFANPNMTDEEREAEEAALDEGYDDPDWDAEESGDAARLEGVPDGVEIAIADDFYEDLDDSVVDEYPDEDLDA